MSPKFYWFLWIFFAVAAVTLWLAGVFTMLTVVVFGFIAFGLIFMGMMSVLPGVVAHGHEHHKHPVKAKPRGEPKQTEQREPVTTIRGWTTYKSA